MYTLIRLLDPEVLISASKNMCLLAFSTSAQSYTLFKNPDVSFLLFWRSNEKMVRARSARKCFFVGKVRWNIGPRIEILALSMAIHAHNSARQLTTGKYYYFEHFLVLELSKGDPECESVSEAHYRRVRLHVVEILSDAYISVLVVLVRA